MDPIHHLLFERLQRFELLRLLGQGGMGKVYEVFDRERSERVALKVLSRVEPKYLYQFKQEFRQLADILHPNLVGLHELLNESGHWFFTMDLVEGSDFLEYVRGETCSLDTSEATLVSDTLADSRFSVGDSTDSKGALDVSPRIAVSLAELPREAQGRLRLALMGLAAGVKVLHDGGKLHRDLKPSNVKVRADGSVVILDFGLVIDRLEDRGEASRGVTVTGTIPYMSPEQGSGELLCQASDWYAVGVMLYEVLTGRLPYTGPATEVMAAKLKRMPATVSSLSPGLPGDLSSLCEDLMQISPDERPTGKEILSRLGTGGNLTTELTRLPAASPESLFGRESHLALLMDSFGRVQEGRCEAVYISGGSGMGKSALVKAFLARLKTGGAVVLQGRCYEQESVPYKAFDHLIDNLARFLAGLRESEVVALLPCHVKALAQVFPVLDQVPAISAAARKTELARDPRELRRTAFTALRELLVKLGEKLPLVAFIDDLQWGDVDSAVLLGELLRPPDPPPLLLVLSYRTENVGSSKPLQTLFTLGEHQEVKQVDVGPLTVQHATAMALRFLDRAVSDREERAARIVSESAGIPFFIEELARHSADLDSSSSDAGCSKGEISMDRYVRERVAAMPAPVRRFLECVALAGRPVPQSVAAQAGKVEVNLAHVLRILRLGRLIRTHGRSADDLVECYHDRIREAVSSGLSEESRGRLHLSLATELEQWGRADPEVLAHHFYRGGEKQWAAVHAWKAADRATGALAFQRASTLYRRCLSWGRFNRQEARQLRFSLAEALANAGRGEEAARAFLDAVPMVEKSEVLQLRLRAAEQLLQTGHTDRGRELLEEVLSEYGLSMPGSDGAAIFSFLRLRGRLKLRGVRFKKTAETDILPRDLERIDACWAVSTGMGLVDPIRAATFQSRTLLLALKAGEPFRVARSLATEGAYAAAFGGKGYQRSERLLKQAAELAQEVDRPESLAVVRVSTAIAAFQQGLWRVTLDNAREAERICIQDCSGETWTLNTARVYQLAAEGWMGHFRSCHRLIRDLVADAESRNDLHTSNHTRAGSMLHIELMHNNPDAARDDIDACTTDLSQQGFTLLHMYALRGRICRELYLGNGKEALELAGQLHRRFKRSTIGQVALMQIYDLEMQTNSHLCAAREELLPVRDVVSLVRSNSQRILRFGLGWTNALAMLWEAAAFQLSGNTRDAAQSYLAASEMFAAEEMLLYQHAAGYRWGMITGGQAGEQAVEKAVGALRREDVARPAAVIAMVAPRMVK